MKNFYSQFMDKTSLVFDVGANIGSRTEVFAELARRVISIEPQDSCVDILFQKSVKISNMHVCKAALGASEGEADIMISDAHQLSSLSLEWIGAVQKSGRFAHHKWRDVERVSVTTLDKLIEQFGVPDFIKIDVEGYEFEVLKGLSRPVKALSFEFTPEYLSEAIMCIGYLTANKMREFNYSLGESMKFELPNWVDFLTVTEKLSQHIDNATYGDVYARGNLP